MEDRTLQLKTEWKRSKRKQSLTALLLLSPYLIIFLIYTIIPFVLGFVYSFMDYNPYGMGNNEFVGFDNYRLIFDLDSPVSKSFWESFSTMLVFDLVAVPCVTLIPLVLAYFLNFHPPGYKLFRAIIYLPSVISISIVGIIFGNMFAGTSSGLINAWLGTEIKWMAGKPFTNDTLRWLVMLLASIWWQTGTSFVIFSGALRDVPKSLYEACEMDGGNRMKCILHVTLPNIRSALMICVFNNLIGYLNLYGQPTVINEMDNGNILVSPMMFIQKYLGGVQYASRTGYICACAIVFGLVVMTFSIVQRKLSAEKRRGGGRSADCRNYLLRKKDFSPVFAADKGGDDGAE